VVEFVLQERQFELLGDAIAECHTDKSASVVAKSDDRFRRDCVGRIDDVGFTLAVGRIVNTDRFAPTEGIDCPINSARTARYVATL